MSDDRFLDCIHCGLCLSSCPTYLTSGNELESPRGRILTLRAIDEGRITPTGETLLHLEHCLLCRACETACPSGVQFGALMSDGRATLKMYERAPLLVRFLSKYLLPRGTLRTLFFATLRLYIGSILQALLRKSNILSFSKRFRALESLLPSEKIKASLNAGVSRGNQTIILLRGCIAQVAGTSIESSAKKVFEYLGCDVRFIKGETCCGAIHEHLGDREFAKKLAKENISIFETTEGQIISTAAGCGAMWKEYPHLLADEPQWKEKAMKIVQRVKDFSEFLVNKELNINTNSGTYTYQVPCHIAHAQHSMESFKETSKKVSLELMEPDDEHLCCGSAGIYNILYPEIADELGAKKASSIMRTGAQTVITANIGCLLQMQKHLKQQGSTIEVKHIAEVIAEDLAGL